MERKLNIKSISNLCSEAIEPNDRIKEIAKDIVMKSNTNDKDALHLASAVYGECKYFITCDDKLDWQPLFRQIHSEQKYLF